MAVSLLNRRLRNGGINADYVRFAVDVW